MDRLNCQPSRVASALTSQKTGTIGLMVPDIANPFFAEAARHFEDHAQSTDHDLMICSTDRDDAIASRYISLLQRKRIDRLIIASHIGKVELIQSLLTDRVPTVLFSADIPSIQVNSVTVDDTVFIMSI